MRTCWNSTLRPISKKRQAEIEAGTYKKPIRKPIRKVNPETAKKWAQARKECIGIYGNKCFLCGRTDLPIHIHHHQETRQQNPGRKYDLTNLVPLCSKCHNHSQADARFYELRDLIKAKMDGLK